MTAITDSNPLPRFQGTCAPLKVMKTADGEFLSAGNSREGDSLTSHLFIPTTTCDSLDFTSMSFGDWFKYMIGWDSWCKVYVEVNDESSAETRKTYKITHLKVSSIPGWQAETFEKGKSFGFDVGSIVSETKQYLSKVKYKNDQPVTCATDLIKANQKIIRRNVRQIDKIVSLTLQASADFSKAEKAKKLAQRKRAFQFQGTTANTIRMENIIAIGTNYPLLCNKLKMLTETGVDSNESYQLLWLVRDVLLRAHELGWISDPEDLLIDFRYALNDPNCEGLQANVTKIQAHLKQIEARTIEARTNDKTLVVDRLTILAGYRAFVSKLTPAEELARDLSRAAREKPESPKKLGELNKRIESLRKSLLDCACA